MSRAIARLKGDRSPFNTSSSDLPEIASDFRSGGAAPQIFDLSCQRFPARRKTWKPKGFPTLNLQGSDFFFSPRACRYAWSRVLPASCPSGCACRLSPLRGRYRSTGSLPQKSPRFRRTCRRKRLKIGALRPRYPRQVSVVKDRVSRHSCSLFPVPFDLPLAIPLTPR